MLLQTDRLSIRRFKSVDLAYLIDMFSDEEVMRFIGPRKAMPETETQAWLTNILQRQAAELTRHAVALKENDELIGVAGLKEEEDGVRDFGYYFRREYWARVMPAKRVRRSSVTWKTNCTSGIIRSLLPMKTSAVSK